MIVSPSVELVDDIIENIPALRISPEALEIRNRNDGPSATGEVIHPLFALFRILLVQARKVAIDECTRPVRGRRDRVDVKGPEAVRQLERFHGISPSDMTELLCPEQDLVFDGPRGGTDCRALVEASDGRGPLPPAKREIITIVGDVKSSNAPQVDFHVPEPKSNI